MTGALFCELPRDSEVDVWNPLNCFGGFILSRRPMRFQAVQIGDQIHIRNLRDCSRRSFRIVPMRESDAVIHRFLSLLRIDDDGSAIGADARSFNWNIESRLGQLSIDGGITRPDNFKAIASEDIFALGDRDSFG